MKRLVILISLVAFVVAAGPAAGATPSRSVPQWIRGSWYHGAQLAASAVPGKASPRVRSRSLAATYSRCAASYSTSVFATLWPTNRSPWSETYCVREDESIPGQLYYDYDFFAWSSNQWVQYGTWFDHVTLAGLSVRVDYCYWRDASGVFGPFYYDQCP